MSFDGFSKKSIDFLKKIRKNNKKEWFLAHRDEYEKLILNPSRAFVVEMGEHLQALEPTINAVPKVNGSLFRIYRDTRFRHDKTPIKEVIGHIFWQGNHKRLQSSYFYFDFGIEEVRVAAGTRWFEKPFLDAYRDYIKNEEKRVELKEILDKLVSLGYEIIPKEYKRYPRGFTKDMLHVDLSLYKGMAAVKKLKPDIIEDGEKLIDTLYNIYEDMLELQQWMYEVSLTIKLDED